MDYPLIDAAFIKHLRKKIAEQDHEFIAEFVGAAYAQDIAELTDKLNPEEVKVVLHHILQSDKKVKVLVEMEEGVREKVLANYTPAEIAGQFIQNMDSDDATYVLTNLPNRDKELIIAQLTDIEFASSLLSLLSYDEHTAGGLMAVELVKANENWTVQQAIDEIRRQAEEVETIYVVYVVDDYL
ncbi:MAG: magnesium transporter MgtE N-terminal domain-containing protein, partial [Bacteroidota bacterium]